MDGAGSLQLLGMGCRAFVLESLPGVRGPGKAASRRERLMSDLIEALKIFLKYGNPEYPFQCSHDTLVVCVDPKRVSGEDKARLVELDFVADDPNIDGFVSYRFGSA